MHRLHATLAPLLFAACVAGVLQAEPAPTMTRTGPIAPLAALSWAQIACDATLTPKATAARVHAEDLMRVAAYFEAKRNTHSLEDACAEAMRHAEPARMEPARQVQRAAKHIEAVVSVALPVR